MNPRTFLRARWRWLAMLNFEAEEGLLRPCLPAGVEVDRFDGRALVSLVAFEFSDARLFGVRVPGHQLFPELNLRFYVRRHLHGGAVRRGVVFIKEIVPRRTVALFANCFYHTNFAFAQLSYACSASPGGHGREVSYRLQPDSEKNLIVLRARGHPSLPAAGSEESFVLDHDYAYTTSRFRSTVEYHVPHRPWRVWKSASCRFRLEAAALLYGSRFAEVLARPPSSAFLADGSAVAVYFGRKIPVGRVIGRADRDYNPQPLRLEGKPMTGA